MKKGESTLGLCLVLPIITVFFLILADFMLIIASATAIKKEVQKTLYDCVTEMEIDQFQTMKQPKGYFTLDINDLCDRAVAVFDEDALPIRDFTLWAEENGRARCEFSLLHYMHLFSKDFEVPIRIRMSVFCERI